MAKQGKIRVGIGGWTFEPWRGVFYPKGLPHAKELEYASRKLTTIEINGTFYRTQTPATFAKWAARGARRLRVLGQGSALCGEPRRAGGGGRLHQAVPRFRPARDGRQARAVAVAVRADQEVRRGRLRQVPGAAARQARRPQAAPRGRGAPRLVLHARVHRAAARVLDPRRLRRARELSGHRRCGRRLRLRAPAEGRGRHPDRLPAQGAWMPGPNARGCGPRARCRAICRSPTPRQSRRPRRATCSSTSSTRARCARPPRPWR